MDIKSVEYRKPDPKAQKADKPTWMMEHFFVVTKDGDELTVPVDPRNRHYMEVRDWYDRKQNKPFEFDFEKVVEAKPEPANRDKGSHIAVTADQTEDADLPDVNLTKKQQSELRAARK